MDRSASPAVFWPNTTRYGCELMLDRTATAVVVSPVGDGLDEDSLARLESFGFVFGKDGVLRLPDRKTFRLSELSDWFPGFSRSDLAEVQGVPLWVAEPEPEPEPSAPTATGL